MNQYGGRRKSARITITLPASVASNLEQRSLHEGRSLSNLAAFLLEQHLDEHNQPPSS